MTGYRLEVGLRALPATDDGRVLGLFANALKKAFFDSLLVVSGIGQTPRISAIRLVASETPLPHLLLRLSCRLIREGEDERGTVGVVCKKQLALLL